MPEDLPSFPTIAGQHGLATYAQLRAAGWSQAQIRHQRTTGWQAPYPRVVVPHSGHLSSSERLTAIALWAGPTAVLTGLSSLSMHTVPVPAVRATTFVVPPGMRSRTHGSISLVRSWRTATVAQRKDSLAIATAARSLADAACYEQVSASDLESLAIAILQRGLCTVPELDRELWQRPQEKVTAVRLGLESFGDGAWSRPEAVLRRLWDTEPNLPELVTNRGLVHRPTGRFLACPDGYLPAFGVAIQVHSRQFHQGIDDRGGDRWAATVEKDSAMVAAGVRVLGVTPWTLNARPRQFLTRVREVVRLGRPSPFPDVGLVDPPGPR